MFQSQTRRLLPRNDSSKQGRYAPIKFQSQTRRLLPRNAAHTNLTTEALTVSIADATLASPQQRSSTFGIAVIPGFNRRRDACFPATRAPLMTPIAAPMFQSQTRRLLPRNAGMMYSIQRAGEFQSQTRRLLPRNSIKSSNPLMG